MNIYHRVWMLAACSCVGVAATNGKGYLCSTGPAALRFRPKTVSIDKSLLPPLPVPAPDAKVSTPPSAINPNTTTVTTAGSVPPVAEPLVATNGFELTPQMLVDVFRSRCKNSNDHDAHVLVPFGFLPAAGQAQPAAPAPGGSSTATYRTE
jgi:hypothetical protein